MPSFAPRTETVKKQEQLLKREVEVRHALQNNDSIEKLTKAIDNYRSSQLSYLKARIHLIKDKLFQNKNVNVRIEDIESAIEIWKNKPTEEIINLFK